MSITDLCLIQEMQENLEGIRTIWAMQLDAARNRLIALELQVAIASLAVVVATVPGAASAASAQALL